MKGLPARLRPGGTAQLLANWAIDSEQTWDERVSQWLAGAGFGAWVWQREVVDPASYVALWLRDAGEVPGSPSWRSRYDSWTSWFADAGILAVGMGLITIKATPGPVVCEDVPQSTDQPIGPVIAGWFTRQAWLADHSDEQLLAARLTIGPDVERVTESVPSASGWSIVNLRLRPRARACGG